VTHIRPCRARLGTSSLLLVIASQFARVGAQTPAVRDDRPTLAVMSFTNGAVGRTADYAALSQGMSEVLITILAANPKIRVLERGRLQKLLDEQHLSATDDVDEETAVRLGRILGAHHFIMGGFVIDAQEQMRLDVRSVSTETSVVEYVETVQGKARDLFMLMDRMGEKLNKGLHLPPLPALEPVIDKTRSKSDQRRAILLLGRALLANDKGDRPGAIAAAKDALVAYPGFQRAQQLLASLQAGTP
jgi:TolB-like protein